MVIPAGFGQANFRFVGAGVPTGAEVTLGFERISTDDAETAANEIGDAWVNADISLSLSSDVDLAEVMVKFGPDATGPSAVVTKVDGGAAATPASPNTAILVKKVTALGGRAGRGRMFIPGVPEAQVDAGGNIDNGWLANLQTAIDDFAASMEVAGWSPALLHGVGSPITEPTSITGLVADPKVATQRRRLRR